MDFVDAANILMSRIENLEPQMGKQVSGVILIDYPERDVIRLACAPEMVLENLVKKTKLQLGLWPRPPVSTLLTTPISINPTPVSDPLNSMPFSPNGSRLYSCQNAVGVPQAPYWDPQQPVAPEPRSVLSSEYASYGDFNSDDLCLQNQAHFTAFDDQMDPKNGFPGEPYYTDAALSNLRSRRSPSLSDLPLKTCHYFSKGFCRHGSNCRYIHGSDYSSYPSLFSPNEFGADDHIISPAALDKLDLEISELLKSRRGNPVSIASLPMLYHEMYRKTLQADGYLTERRRQGRAGYSLTKLLGQLKRIRLIERAHGQHDVILAEDAPKFNLDNRSERNDPGQIVSGSRQIYLTFPPESTFSEEDVSDYFSSNFGPVEDVRIPCQQKRMFGFVTFASADAVKTALAKGNPHFVCGSRVLVKPYREKSKPVDRKNMEKNDHVLRFEAPRFKRQLIKDQEQDLEMKRRYLSQLQIGRKNIINDHIISNDNGNGMEDLYASDVHSYIPNMEQYYMMDAFRNCTINDDRSKHLSTDDADNESIDGINLPESPFSSTIGNSNREEQYF